jgi:hypothetical protein
MNCMTISKAKLASAVVIAVLCAGSSVAMAGLVSGFPVSITLLNGSRYQAVGSLTSARFSSDTVQNIGCLADSNGLAECWAQDSTGRYVACTSTSSNALRAAASVTPASNINFQFTNGSSTCAYVLVENRSDNLP